MAYEWSESVRDNFGKFIDQFQPKTKTYTRKHERILIKLYRLNVSLFFNETCLNERQLPNYPHIHAHTHTHTHIYIYIYNLPEEDSCYYKQTHMHPWEIQSKTTDIAWKRSLRIYNKYLHLDVLNHLFAENYSQQEKCHVTAEKHLSGGNRSKHKWTWIIFSCRQNTK